MSWTAYLRTPSGKAEYGEWNYTHNTNRMVELALERAGRDPSTTAQPFWASIYEKAHGPDADFPMGRWSWWDLLHEASGADGKLLLAAVVREIEDDPDAYRALNPENGWGDCDSLVKLLRDMRDRVPDEEPSRWTVHG